MDRFRQESQDGRSNSAALVAADRDVTSAGIKKHLTSYDTNEDENLPGTRALHDQTRLTYDLGAVQLR